MRPGYHNPLLRYPVPPFLQGQRKQPREVLACFVRRAAEKSLYTELMLTPKPGLVDRSNNGAHRDMTFGLFLESIEAIAPFFADFFKLGHMSASLPPATWLGTLRQLGQACENAMFTATKGVNTHKGAVFALGLLCAAAGYCAERRRERKEFWTREALCAVVSQLCQGMVERELQTSSGLTAGERIFKRHGLTGARGEAESGFATVRNFVLPVYDRMKQAGYGQNHIHHQLLLELMAVNDDTTLVARGGLEGLHFVQSIAAGLLWKGGSVAPDFSRDMVQFDAKLIETYLSPGGSADLFAVSCFLVQFPSCMAMDAAFYSGKRGL